MGYEEQLQRSIRSDGVSRQRSPDQAERVTEEHRGGWLTGRLVLLVLMLIFLGAASGLTAALVSSKTYGARAEILYSIRQAQQGGDPLEQDRQLFTQPMLLKSRAVLGPIAQKQGRPFKDLDNQVNASVLGNTNIIQVDVHGSTELAAIQTLQAVMDNYLLLTRQVSRLTRDLDAHLADASANTNRLQRQEQQRTTEVIAGTATQASLHEAQAQLTASVEREKAIQARIDEVKLSDEAAPAAQLLTPPYPLPDPVIPQPLLAAGAGALAGLIVAGGILVVAARHAKQPPKSTAWLPHR